MAATKRTRLRQGHQGIGTSEGHLLDSKTSRRLFEVSAATALLLGEASPAASDATLGELIGRLLHRLGEHGEESAQAEQARHEHELMLIQERFERRRSAFGEIQVAVDALREITLPAAMLTAAPRLLCEASDLDRVLLSTIEQGRLIPRAACFRDAPQSAERTLAELAGAHIAIGHPLIEAEVLRRHRATVVADAHLHPRAHRDMCRIMGWRSYVVAPVMVKSRMIGVLHADRAGGPLDVMHRDLLWWFATGLAEAHESAALRRRLRGEREQARRFLQRLDIRLAALSEQAIRFSLDLPKTETPRSVPQHGTRDGVLADILTKREIEILRLLADGLTNRAIANRLVVSDGTVKFHVNGILRKLRASNRAEAVSRYLTLSQMRAREGSS